VARSIKTGPVGKAQPHQEGAAVYLVQQLVHEPVGALAYRWSAQWQAHANLAQGAAQELELVHAQLVDVPELSGHVRLVPDALATTAYEAGSSMVSNVVRTLRHLAAAMVWEANIVIEYGRALDELRDATGKVGLDPLINSPGYHGAAEIVQVRDALEHPKTSNLYQGNDTDWDKVPLAWILSNRSLAAYNAYVGWLNRLGADFEAWRAARPPQPTTLTVERGIGSRYPMKKPPND
jgi:hypothetical protein